MRAWPRHNVTVRIDHEQFNGITRRTRADHLGGQSVDLPEGIHRCRVLADDRGLARLVFPVRLHDAVREQTQRVFVRVWERLRAKESRRLDADENGALMRGRPRVGLSACSRTSQT